MSELSREQQIESLEFVLGLIDRCRGFSDRDTHRAYLLGARILGLRYKDACRLYKNARLHGASAAVERDPDIITAGEYVGEVYFASTSDGLVKIGHSTDPAARIRVVSRQIRRPLDLVATVRGFMLHEHVMHIAAKAAWLGGEFYDAVQLASLPDFAFLDRRQKPQAVA